MTRVTIYTGIFCGFCDRAKYLFDTYLIPFEEINIALDPARRSEMIKRSGGCKTVPQIFIDDEHIGGCEDLYALEKSGTLDQMLNLSNPEQSVMNISNEAKASLSRQG